LSRPNKARVLTFSTRPAPSRSYSMARNSYPDDGLNCG
jgi:hypothetical protein